MREANFQQINHAPPGSFLYNPTAWGTFTPKSPPELFAAGEFNEGAELLLSHAAREGAAFTGAFVEHKTSVERFVEYAFPDADQDEKEWIIDTYGPTSRQPTADEIAYSIEQIIGDATFRCQVTYASDAKYQYLFRQQWNTTRSATHGGDLAYLFYQTGMPVSSVRSARILQDYVLTFALYRRPLTRVFNPPLVGLVQPAPYLRTNVDFKTQLMASYKTRFPKVTRVEAEGDDTCRVWGSLSAT